MSPYGNKSKLREEITDVAKVSHINAILLRYFNPIEHILPLKLENYLLVPQNLVPAAGWIGRLSVGDVRLTEQRWDYTC
jgi:UDP-glucose 4-epimerase